jgi:DtxR family Mn-dependent transcriptional regulator
MISVAVESADGAPTTVELGSPAAQAIWMVAR